MCIRDRSRGVVHYWRQAWLHLDNESLHYWLWSSYGAVRAYSAVLNNLWGPRDSDLSDSWHVTRKFAFFQKRFNGGRKIRTHDQRTIVLPTTPFVKALVRWATGKRPTNRLPKLSLITGYCRWSMMSLGRKSGLMWKSNKQLVRTLLHGNSVAAAQLNQTTAAVVLLHSSSSIVYSVW